MNSPANLLRGKKPPNAASANRNEARGSRSRRFPGRLREARPALVVQGDAFSDIPSVTLLPLTSDLQQAPLLRITVEPSPENGLLKTSQIMVDKAATVTRATIGRQIGHIDGATCCVVDRALLDFLELR